MGTLLAWKIGIVWSWERVLSLTVGLLLALRCAAQLELGPGWHCWNHQQPLPLQQGQPGAPSTGAVWNLPPQGWLSGAGLLLPKGERQSERLCWGRHPRANFEPPAASKGSRNKEQLGEWEITVSVFLGLISRSWNLSNVQPECMCYYCLICMLSVTECS